MVKGLNNKKQGVVKQEPTHEVKIEEMDDDVAPLQTAPQTADKKKSKHNKIIIRNLIVDINEKHIRKLCSPFGEITDIQIPMHELKKCSRGFVFVEFTTKNMCLKAIKELNNTSYKGRTIIADLAVSKDKFEEFKDAQKNQVKMEEEPVKEEEVQVKKEEPSKKEQKKKGESKPDVKKEETDKDQKSKEPEDLSSSIFIRNLASTITEKDLFNFAKRFGKIKFAKVVVDQETKECKGSAFVKFMESEPAQRLIQYSRHFEQSQVPNSKIKFREDPEINLDLQGRVIQIFPAESREQLASKLDTRETKEKKVSKPLNKIRKLEDLVESQNGSKRNLEFALLGCYKPQPWMKREDTQKFQYHEAEKLEKLKNPNNRVSDTRIVLKYLPKDMTEQNLKQVVYTFLREKHPQSKQLLTWCKLMLDSERKKSSGVAFIEFAKSNVSVAFLKWLEDSKKEVFQNSNVLFEFAIQDARKLAKFNKTPKKEEEQDAPKPQKSFKKGKKIFKKKF